MSQKFWTKIPRYVDGQYIAASPDHPAVVVFPAHVKVKMREDGKTPEDNTLTPYEESAPPPVVPLAKPFAEVRRGPQDVRKSHEADRKVGRPSDSDPAGR
jgi:hypothetical protein